MSYHGIPRDVLLKAQYFKLGIVPMDWDTHSVVKQLESMHPLDAERAKRKFRKLWRKIAKNPKLHASWKCAAGKMGLGQSNPGKRFKKSRRQEVHSYVEVVLLQEKKT